MTNHQPFESLERLAECRLKNIPCSGEILLEHLCKRFNYLGKADWLEQIAFGNIEINGVVIKDASYLVNSGDILHFSTRHLEEPDVSWDIETLFENDDYVILNKPSPLPCHPSGAFFNHTLWAWCKQVMRIEVPHFVGRLDRETSGIVIVAKDSKTAAKLSKLPLKKEYLALVHGKFPQHIQADGWLGCDKASVVKKKRHFYIQPPHDDTSVETANTEFFCEKPDEHGITLPGEEISLVRCILGSGRMHQIRATLYSLGYPVVGDKLYGKDENMFIRQIGNKLSDKDISSLIMPRQALHAWRLHFPDGFIVTAPWKCMQ